MIRSTARRGLLAAVLITGGCQFISDSDLVVAEAREPRPDFFATYAELARRVYTDALDAARVLRHAVILLLEAPSEDSLVAARACWLMSREPYGQTEVFRHAPFEPAELNLNKLRLGAPIEFDAATGQLIAATGYHAVEFLLWGPEPGPDGPVHRGPTDFLPGDPIRDRRRTQLRAATDGLVEDCRVLARSWERPAVLAGLEQTEAVRGILTGMITTAVDTSREGITAALNSPSPEHELSSFSDSTDQDLLFNIQGLVNVFQGEHGDFSGTGLVVPLSKADVKLAARLNSALVKARHLADQQQTSFHKALLGDDEAREHLVQLAALLEDIGNLLRQSGKALKAPVSPLSG